MCVALFERVNKETGIRVRIIYNSIEKYISFNINIISTDNEINKTKERLLKNIIDYNKRKELM